MNVGCEGCLRQRRFPAIKELGISLANIRLHRLHVHNPETAGSTQNRPRTKKRKGTACSASEINRAIEMIDRKNPTEGHRCSRSLTHPCQLLADTYE
jgi:hypothetical protein